MKKILFCAALGCIFSYSVQANEVEFRNHHINAALSVAISDVHYPGYPDNGERDVFIGYDLAYLYDFNNRWGLELGLKRHNPEPISSLVSSIGDVNIVFDNVSYSRLAGVYSWNLSSKRSLMFKLGVQLYDFDFEYSSRVTEPSTSAVTKSQKSGSKNGTGLYIGLGFRTQFNSGIELGVSYDFQKTNYFDTQSLNLEIGYAF